MRQHFLSDIIGNYLVKKIVRFFFVFNSCPLPLHTYFMVDKAKSICSFVDHKEISFVCFAELFRLVPISSESSFLGHHDYLEKERQQEGVSRRSVCGHQF